MEVQRAKAEIYWLSFDEGGRLNPVAWSDRGYWGVAKFEQAGEEWSVKVFDATEENGTDFGIEFLSDKAPHELLVHGQKFELREGRKTVARGEVI